MSVFTRTAVVLLIFVCTFTSSISSASSVLPQRSPRRLKTQDRIYLVPLGVTSVPSLTKLKSYYKQKFGLTVEILPLLRMESGTLDSKRKQVIAEEAIKLMERGCHEQANDPTAIVIGITPYDMYIREKSWQFAFSFRQAGRFAVVSSAHMNPVSFRQPADDALLTSRVRKMVTKNIGLMHYKLPMNNNPRSVMFRSILGLAELDRIGEDF
jgi:predicted Zn-dependent protease